MAKYDDPPVPPDIQEKNALRDAIREALQEFELVIDPEEIESQKLAPKVTVEDDASGQRTTEDTGSTNRLIFNNGTWHGSYNGQPFENLKNTNGVTYIANLLDHPEIPISTTDLYKLTHPQDPNQPVPEISTGDSVAKFTGETLDVDAAISPDAIQEFRDALADLKEKMNEADNAIQIAQEMGNTSQEACASEELERLKGEREAILKHLGQTTRPGPDGERISRISGVLERRRKAVLNAIGRAKKAIKECSPPLAEHLDAAIKTGQSCRYLPTTPTPDWEIEYP